MSNITTHNNNNKIIIIIIIKLIPDGDTWFCFLCVYFRHQKIMIQNTGLTNQMRTKIYNLSPLGSSDWKIQIKLLKPVHFVQPFNPFELFEPREPFIPLKSLKPFKQFNPFKILNPLSYLNHLGTFLHSSNPLNQCYNLKLFEFPVPV